MMDWLRQAWKSDERGSVHSPARSQGKLALAVAVIATALSLVLGFAYLTSFRRLERDMTRLSQQTEALSRQVERAEKQSQMSAQQASQSAAHAEAAAQQRDLAKQAQSDSEAQTEVARQQAAAQQQRADQATQQAEQYRKAREVELAQLEEALGQIAETHRTAMGLVMTLDSKSIRFDFDKADIKPEYRDILNRIAGILMTLKGFTIAIYGYTDDVGTQSYNLQLSRRRAEAVRDFLVQTGISATILSTRGFGKSDPRTPGNSEQARAANRRVEIAIVEAKVVTDILPVEPK
jgi:outer membrane protein OmpA-like peptidoglycan-associated protein